MIIALIISLVIISATLHIYFDNKRNYLLTYLFKPLTMVLIIIAALIKPHYFTAEFKYYILLGLAFSLIGDLFLMIKQSDYFIQGLVAFLFAHFAYLAAIITEGAFSTNWIILIPVIIYVITLLKFILPNTGKKKFYVSFYASVIGILLWQAISITLVLQNQQILFFMLGIVFFTISDSLLAYNKFTKKRRNAQVKILSSYYLAQILIMLSI